MTTFTYGKPSRLRSRTAIASALTITVVVTALTPLAAAEPWPSLSWGPCPADYNYLDPAQNTCATISVPQDYTNPNGEKIDLLITRHAAAATPADRKGVIFTNPGGPSGDAINFNADAAASMPADVRENWDVIAVQPRGLAHTTALDCPLTAEETIAAVNVSEFSGNTVRAACERGKPGSTRHISTANTAKDWNAVRAALGLTTIDIYGVSYGTIYGATYATLFPQYTGKVILDSAMNRDELWTDAAWYQNAGFKKRFYRLMEWIAAHNDHYDLGDTPLKVYQRWSERIVEEAGGNPTIAPPPAQVGDVPPALEALADAYRTGADLTGPARVKFEAFLRSLANPTNTQVNSTTYSSTNFFLPRRNSWPFIAQMIRDGNEPAPFAADVELDSHSPRVKAAVMRLIAQCNESVAPPKLELIPGFLWHTFVQPDFYETIFYTYASGALCAGAEPVRAVPELSNKDLAFTPLVLQSREDPQTSYPSGVQMAKDMKAHLITVGGGDHGAMLSPGNAALQAAISQYYNTGKTPVTNVPQAPITAPLG